mgnify:CR=1 FL=1
MLSNMTEQEFETEKDMLRGNLGRMCVSDDKKGFDSHHPLHVRDCIACIASKKSGGFVYA